MAISRSWAATCTSTVKLLSMCLPSLTPVNQGVAIFACCIDWTPASFYAPASFTLSHTLSLDSYYRPTAGKSSSPAWLSTVVYAYVIDCAPASPYAYSSSTHRFPDERTPIGATPLSATWTVELVMDDAFYLFLQKPPYTHWVPSREIAKNTCDDVAIMSLLRMMPYIFSCRNHHIPIGYPRER
jgi:hypothetical protein